MIKFVHFKHPELDHLFRESVQRAFLLGHGLHAIQPLLGALK